MEEKKRPNILQEADGIIHGDRRESYGHPADNFARVAKIWSTILSKKLKTGITPQEVGLMMVGLKLSRCVNRLTRDNLVDMAGYAGTVEMILDRIQEDGEDEE